MADNNAADVKPAPQDAIAVSSKKQRFKEVKDDKQQQRGSSLVARCRAVVVANMEKYPAEMFGMIAEDDWEDILRSKHRQSAPKSGTGGLDGTGRRTPALSARFLAEVESINDHLAESPVADQLVWKDCVEYQFSRAGLTRPKGLLLPWPDLVKQLADQAAVLVDYKKREDEADLEDIALQFTEEDEKAIAAAAHTLRDSPMNLKLLKESGIGKALKKLIKASSQRLHVSIFERIQMSQTTAVATRAPAKEISVLSQLEKLLKAWMDLAASKGVDVQASNGKKIYNAQDQFQKDAGELRRVEDCMAWRQLFALLKEGAEDRRANLGQKIRDNRKRENKVRPKIMKVRTMSRRQGAILDKAGGASRPTWERGGGNVASHGGAKILSLRKEAAVQGQRQKGGLPTFKKQSGFGQAVAFAAVTKLTPSQKMSQMQDRKRKAAALVSMGKGKRMAVPAKQMRMQGTNFKNRKAAPKEARDSQRRR